MRARAAAGAVDSRLRPGLKILVEWIIAMWLVACLAWALMGTRIGFIEKDITLFALSFVACISLASVMGRPAARGIRRRAASQRRRDP